MRVADYLIEKDRLFARVTLDDAEYRLYEQVYAKLDDRRRPSPTWWSTCRRRWTCCSSASPGAASPTSSTSTARYLERLNEAYARFFHEYEAAPLLIVNAAAIDPVDNAADYDELLAAIRRMTPRPALLQPDAQRGAI